MYLSRLNDVLTTSLIVSEVLQMHHFIIDLIKRSARWDSKWQNNLFNSFHLFYPMSC